MMFSSSSPSYLDSFHGEDEIIDSKIVWNDCCDAFPQENETFYFYTNNVILVTQIQVITIKKLFLNRADCLMDRRELNNA